MKFSAILLLVVAPLLASSAFGATYELRRIAVTDNLSATSLQSRCHFTPGSVLHRTIFAGITTDQTTLQVATDDVLQGLVDSAVGVAVPQFGDATNFTNWWVRSSDSAEFKLVRSNVTYRDGHSQLLQDQSDAGQKLAVFMGVNCARTFGQ